MGKWRFLIGLTVLVIWALASWIQNRNKLQERKSKMVDAFRPRRDKPEPRTELDRIMEELARRTQETERKPTPSGVEGLSLPTTQGGNSPSRKRPRQAGSKTVTAQTRPGNRAADVLQILEAQPAPHLPPPPASTPAAYTQMPGSHAPRTEKEKAQAVGLAKIPDLLKSPDSLATLVVLQEVLGPPLSRRRRRKSF